MANILFIFTFSLVGLARYLEGRSALLPLLLLGGFFIAKTIEHHCKRRRQVFILELRSVRRGLLRDRSVVLNNRLISLDSEVTSYTLHIGFLFTDCIIRSPYRLRRDESTVEGLVYALLTLVTGWWSLYGALATYSAAHSNLSGGEVTTVRSLLSPSANQPAVIIKQPNLIPQYVASVASKP